MASLRDVLQIGAVSVGIDIGTAAIKIAELRRTARGVELPRFGVAATPQGAVEAGLILDRVVVGEAVRRLLRETRIRPRRAVVSVTGQNVLARVLRLPPIPEDEVKQAIRWEAERHLPFPVDEAVIDAQTVREVVDEGQRQIEVLLAAAPEGLVMAHLETLDAAHVYVEAVEVGALAMARALNGSAQGTFALVNLGDTTTDVAVVRDGVPQFTRTIPGGGAQVTETLARQLRVTPAQAEEMKQRHGMGWDDTPEAAASSAGYAAEIAEGLAGLLGHVRRSLDFYRAQFPGAAIDGAVLCGGGARLRHLAQHFTAELDLPVAVGNPFTRIRPGSGLNAEAVQEVGPQLVVATGLALRLIA